MNKEFIFGPEHEGKPVYHKYGQKGTIERIDFNAGDFQKLVVTWADQNYSCLYCLNGRAWAGGARVVYLDEPHHRITVKDCALAINYGPDGLTTFGITAEYQGKEQPATVALFDFLRWCLDQNFIGGYSAEEVGEEIVTLPVPPELEDNRLSLRVLHVCDWLRTLPLSVIETACNGNLSMWQLLDAETGENV